MKIKIKSREEIEKTLDGRNHKERPSCYFAPKMFDFCGKIFEANPSSDLDYSVYTPLQEGMDYWHWHKDWYEVIEHDLTADDLMDIELMNEMLAYFLSSRNN